MPEDSIEWTPPNTTTVPPGSLPSRTYTLVSATVSRMPGK